MLNVAVRKKLLAANPCSGVEFPVAVKGLFRPHYVYWSEQRQIEFHAPPYLRNMVQIITETGFRVYKELNPMRKDQVDLQMRWSGFRIQDSERYGRNPSPRSPSRHSRVRWRFRVTARFCFRATGIRAALKSSRLLGERHFDGQRFPIFAFTIFAPPMHKAQCRRRSRRVGNQMLRQSDAQVFKKYSQMKLQMKREAWRSSTVEPTKWHR